MREMRKKVIKNNVGTNVPAHVDFITLPTEARDLPVKKIGRAHV